MSQRTRYRQYSFNDKIGEAEISEGTGLEINILFVIVVLILTAGAVWGWKRGLLDSMIRIISCILGILVIIVMAKGIGNFIQKSYVQVIMALILLVLIQVIHKVMKFLTDTLKLVRAIPIGKLADKFAGTALGLAEAVFIIWLVFLLIGVFDVMDINAWITEQVGQSSFLTMLYYSNYLVDLLGKIL